MKPNHLIAALSLAAMAFSAVAAAPDRSYYVTELAPQQKFDVYNDGQNTYLESIPGLVVTGATADGERYIVNGVPAMIRGFMNGKPITVVRGAPPAPPAPRPQPPDAAKVNAQIQQLDARLAALQARSAAATVAGRPLPPGFPSSPPIASTVNGAPMPAQTGPAAPLTAMPTKIGIDDQVAWRVTPADQNLRMLVERWSKSIGWTSIWDVERDIPISMSDEKVNNFKTAVRRVLSATEFGDLQVKPCFYSNAVLRVVRKTTKCNPNE